MLRGREREDSAIHKDLTNTPHPAGPGRAGPIPATTGWPLSRAPGRVRLAVAAGPGRRQRLRCRAVVVQGSRGARGGWEERSQKEMLQK